MICPSPTVQYIIQRIFYTYTHTHAFTQKTFTQKNAYGSFYTPKNLRTETFTHRSVYGAANRNFHAELLLPRAAFTHTHTHVYTQKFSNTKAFAHGSVYGAQNLLDREAFTHRNFDTEKSYTEELLHTDVFRSCCTERSFHRQTFTDRNFYRQNLLHTETFIHRNFYTQSLSTQRSLYTEEFLPAVGPQKRTGWTQPPFCRK